MNFCQIIGNMITDEWILVLQEKNSLQDSHCEVLNCHLIIFKLLKISELLNCPWLCEPIRYQLKISELLNCL